MTMTMVSFPEFYIHYMNRHVANSVFPFPKSESLLSFVRKEEGDELHVIARHVTTTRS
jgi:hypothetical protein